MIRQLAVLCFLFAANLSVQGQLNMDLVSQFDYPFNTNDIWGYVADNGDEYALVGTRHGLSIVNLEQEPLEEVAFLDGSSSTWRDIKTWGEYAYVSTEAADGLLVADLRNLPDTVPYYFWKPAMEVAGQPGISDTLLTIHNIFIDEYGILHIAGSNLNNGGVIFADVATNPWEPEMIGTGAPVYSHDAFARDSILYSSEIYRGTLAIYDYSDLNNIRLIGSQQTPFVFTHNAWLSDDSKYVFTTDERGNAPVTSYDISDINDIRELDRYVPAETEGQGVVPHNVHVWNDWLVISYYSDGGKIVDASRPDNLVEVGSFDTFLEQDPGFGAWGAYPFLPSRKVLITDSGNGLFVLEPNYVRAAFLEGKVEGRIAPDGNGNEEIIPLVNAEVVVHAVEEFILPATTKAQGIYKTGKAIPGRFMVEISAEGFITWQDTVVFENGLVTELNVILESNTTTSISEDPLFGSSISIYPNPVSDYLLVDLSAADRNVALMRILDANGKPVLERSGLETGSIERISASTWVPGAYIFQFVDHRGQATVKKVQVLH